MSAYMEYQSVRCRYKLSDPMYFQDLEMRFAQRCCDIYQCTRFLAVCAISLEIRPEGSSDRHLSSLEHHV